MANERGPARRARRRVRPAAPGRPDPRAARRAHGLVGRPTWPPCTPTPYSAAGRTALLDRLATSAGSTRRPPRCATGCCAGTGRMAADSTDAAALRRPAGGARPPARRPPGAGRAGRAARVPRGVRALAGPAARVGFALEHLLGAAELPGVDLRRAGGRRAGGGRRRAPAARRPGATGTGCALAGTCPTRDRRRTAPAGSLSGDHDCVLATSSVPGRHRRLLRAARRPATCGTWPDRADSRWVVPLGAVRGAPATRTTHDQLPAVAAAASCSRSSPTGTG